MRAKNLRPPIKLKNINFSGFAASAGRAGDPVKVWVQLASTSDHPDFHLMVDGLRGLLAAGAGAAKTPIDISQANSVLLVIHPDNTADLWVDSVAVVVEARMKRPIKAGEAIFDGDVADVIKITFPDVDLKPDDRLLYLFREGWRFGLFFDLTGQGKLSPDKVARALARLYRNLKYRHLFDTLAKKSRFSTSLLKRVGFRSSR